MTSDDKPLSDDATLPLSAAVVPAVLFTTLAYLADAAWPGVARSGEAYFLLGLGVALPIAVMATGARDRAPRLAAIMITSLGSVALAFHTGLGERLALDLDTHPYPSAATMDAAAGIYLTAVAIPLGLLAVGRASPRRMLPWIAVPAATGAAGQLLWFALTRALVGPGGIDLWMWSRVIIVGGAGVLAGLLAGAARIHGARSLDSGAISPVGLLLERLPSSLPLALILAAAIGVGGAARVAARLTDDERFVTHRLDEYYLALSNLRLARSAGMEYPELGIDLARARRALEGSARSDPDLVRLLERLMTSMENRDPGPDASATFEADVLALDRHLMARGVPFFLEPHELEDRGDKVRFVMRYSVAARRDLPREEGAPLVLLRLRRLDSIMVDTPFTGISYPGIGTVLMDHIDDSALRIHGRALGAAVHEPRGDDGKFAEARAAMRAEKRAAITEALARKGHREAAVLEGLAAMGGRWAHRIDTERARSFMDARTLAVFDALTDLLAAQTEVHEARHALDGEREFSASAIEALDPGPLGGSAAAEARAHLTEIVEGPMGPRFGLASVFEMLAGKNARANAYFFAAIVIMEGLWGEVVRKPDVVTRDGPAGSADEVLPIGPDSPGWLSYSRTTGCYSALRKLPPHELRRRAKALFEEMFDEEYRPVKD